MLHQGLIFLIVQFNSDNTTTNGTCQSGLNSEQVSLMRPIYIEIAFLY